MGICNREGKDMSNKLFSGESYSNFDKTILLQKFYMENMIGNEELSPFFTLLIYNQIINEKKSQKKSERFFKWFNMALNPYHKLLSSLKKESILASLKEKN